MSGSDGTLLLASVTGETREAAETTAEDQHTPTIEAKDGTMAVATATMAVATATMVPTIKAMDGTMPVATTATEPTIEATDSTMPVETKATEPTIEATDSTIPVATTATEPAIGATDGTMPVATAAIETTETTGIFHISEIISIKIKELRTNSDSIVNNISCNEPPNCSTPKSNWLAVESNSLNCNHKNAHLTMLEGLHIKINVPDVQDVQDVPEDNVLKIIC